MKKSLLFFTIFLIAVLTDISMEFKDIIIPRVQTYIIEPILEFMPKEEDRRDMTTSTESQEKRISKVVKMVREKKEAIDLKYIKPMIDTQNNPLCPLDTPLDRCLPQKNIKLGNSIFIRIFKLTAELELWIRDEDYYQLLKAYPICKQSGELGPKLKEGDHQGVEGFYNITKKSLNPNSKYHLSFNLGYPNAFDRLNRRTGSALMVHGGCKSVGCYAMGDKYMEEIYKLTESAFNHKQMEIAVHIFPFRMRDEIMIEYSDNEWYNFWGNLKEGYDYFEEAGVPPKVRVLNRRYEFE